MSDGRGAPLALDEETVARALHRLFIGDARAALRKEDVQKARELAPLLVEVGRVLPARAGAAVTLVDAACGKSAWGLLVGELVCAPRGLAATITLLERDPRVLARAREALPRARLGATTVATHEADVDDDAAWPVAPDVVMALHACGAATDRVIDRAIAVGARHVLVVPCCYGARADRAPDDGAPDGQRLAPAWAEAMGLPRHALVGRAFSRALIDAERTLRLEAAGYETHVVEAFPPTVSPHHLLFRARRAVEPVRMAEAAARHARLTRGS